MYMNPGIGAVQVQVHSPFQVTGLDGNYRITCHTVMEVLREHRDSVMAVLEAFVYDPLLNWRLMDSK